MQEEITAQGIELMLYGMGTVVLFLALLVVATTVMSRLLARYAPQPEPLTAPLPHREPPGVGQDPNLVAAISAAIHQYRAKRK